MRCSIFPPDDDMLQRWDSVGNEGGIVYPQSTRLVMLDIGVRMLELLEGRKDWQPIVTYRSMHKAFLPHAWAQPW